MSLDETGVPGTQKEQETLSKIKSLLTLTEKTLKSIMVYPEGSPVSRRHRELLYDQFKSYFLEQGELTIKVTETALKVGDQVVYETETRGRNLSFLFFRDGLKEITFFDGLTPEELDGFLEALAENWMGTGEETDVVSSFWERDFLHINYTAINELFDDLMVSMLDTESPPGQAGQAGSALFSGRITFSGEDGKGGGDEGETFPLWMDRERGKKELSFLLTHEDLDYIKALLEEDRRTFNPSREFISALLSLIVLEAGTDKYSPLVSVLKEYLSELISRGEFGMVREMVRAVGEVKDLPGFPAERYKRLVAGILEVIRCEASIEKVKQIVNSGSVTSWDDLLGVLSYSGNNAIPVLLDLLLRRENKEMHSKVRGLLVRFAKEDPGSVGRWISDSRPPLVKQVVSVLGRAGEGGIPYLRRCLRHPDTDVRREVVRALFNIGGHPANGLLSKFLLDPDPEVRILAAKCLDTPDPKVVGIVCELISQKDFRKTGIREQKAMVGILGKASNEKAVETLRALLWQKSWFKKGDMQDLKLYVIQVLSKIGSASARKILEEGRKVRDKRIWQACELALQKMGDPDREEREGLRS